MEIFKRKNANDLAAYDCREQFRAVITREGVRAIQERLENRIPNPTNADIEFDRWQIFVGVNTWCYIFQDVVHASPNALGIYVQQMGLQEAVRESDEYYLYLITYGSRGSNSPFWNHWLGDKPLITKEISTLLKFLKRLQLRTVTVGQEEAFLATNEACGRFETTSWRVSTDTDPAFGHPSWYLMERLRAKFTNIFRKWKQDTSLFRLPPGSPFEKCNCYLDKFLVVVENQNWLRDNKVNIPILTGGLYTGYNREPSRVKRYITVPKNMFKGRGVAPEPVARQVLGYQVSNGLHKCLKRFGINTHDQEPNRLLSRDRDYCTLDLKAASDSIALGLVCELFQKDLGALRRALFKCRTPFIYVGGNMYVDNHFLTMGNTNTFDLETGIFLAIMQVAVDFTIDFYRSTFFTKKNGKVRVRRKDRPDGFRNSTFQEFKAKVSRIKVFGDDIVVHKLVFDTAIDLLHIFGFEVNTDKTFSGDDSYHESCGAEWYEGRDVSGSYFSRSLGSSRTAELVALQQKLVDYDTASNFLIDLILDDLPSTITSTKGCEYDDIWSPYPIKSSYAGFSTYGKIYQNYEICYTVQSNEVLPNAYTLTTRKNEITKNVSEKLVIALTGRFLYSSDTDPIQNTWLSVAGALCYRHGVSDLHRFTNVHFRKVGSPWLKSMKLEDLKEVDQLEQDYEYHMMLDSRQSRKLPEDENHLRAIEDCMYLLTLGGAVEHMQADPFISAEKMIRDRRDLLGDREMTWMRRRILR